MFIECQLLCLQNVTSCSIDLLLNLFLYYHDCEPWQSGVQLRAWFRLKPLSACYKLHSLIQQAETKTPGPWIEQEATNHRQGRGAFVLLIKSLGEELLGGSNTPPGGDQENCCGGMFLWGEVGWEDTISPRKK